MKTINFFILFVNKILSNRYYKIINPLSRKPYFFTNERFDYLTTKRLFKVLNTNLYDQAYNIDIQKINVNILENCLKKYPESLFIKKNLYFQNTLLCGSYWINNNRKLYHQYLIKTLDIIQNILSLDFFYDIELNENFKKFIKDHYEENLDNIIVSKINIIKEKIEKTRKETKS